jgi:hypothetical protein
LSRCENAIGDIEMLKPYLILMDLWIPENGREKDISIIKENPATTHIPVWSFRLMQTSKKFIKIKCFWLLRNPL